MRLLTLLTALASAASLAGQPLCNAMQAGFSHAPTPNGVQFTDQTIGNRPTSWSWDFGDGHGSDQQNPFHAYAQSGTYQVCLTTWYRASLNSRDSCRSTHCETVLFQRTPTNHCSWLNANFTFNHTPNGVQFNYNAASPTTGTTFSYLWDFGDGSTSTDQNPLHRYASGGRYQVCLTVTARTANGAAPCTANYCHPVELPVQPPRDCSWLNANFTFARTSAGVQFTYTPTSPSAGTVYRYQWDFGDGSTSTDQNPLHPYTATGTYRVCLTVTAHANNNTTTPCTATFCHDVRWEGPPQNHCSWLNANFTFTRSTTGVQFNYSPPNPNAQYRYSWDFGDGNTSTDQNPLHTYATPGNYRACLTVTAHTSNSTAPCTATFCHDVRWEGPPQNHCSWLHARFTERRTPQGIAFQYDPPVPGAVYTYLWDFGDGSTSTDRNPVHAYAADGSYPVCLVVTAHGATGTNVSCTARSCRIVDWHTPRPDPCAWLDAGFTSTATPNGVQFNYGPRNPNGQYRYQWDFGDGNTSTDQNPFHTYAAPGNYRVCLTVTALTTNSPAACTARSCETIHWQGRPQNDCSWLHARFTVARTNAGLQFNYSPPDPNARYRYQWDFGDGGTSTDQNPLHTYRTGGNYRVCLTVTALANNSTTRPCTATFCHGVTVDGPNTRPCAGNTVSIHTGPSTSSGTVVLWATSSPAANGYIWNFGDGSMGTGPQVSHTYRAPGTYNVCVTAWWLASNTSRDTCRVRTCRTILVGHNNNDPCDRVRAGFTHTVSSNSVGFTNTSAGTNPNTRYHWSFGDGSTSTDQNPVHTYRAPGNYRACLVVAVTLPNNNGAVVTCMDTVCAAIVIGRPPQNDCSWLHASFTSTRTRAGLQFNYSPPNPNAQYRYQWDFGDGNTSTDQNPLHTYRADGRYQVCLVVTAIPPAGTVNRVCTARSCENVGWQGIAPWPEEESFTVYPQPATDHVMIAGPEDAPTGVVLRLYGMDGHEVRQERVEGWPHRVGLDGLAPGMHLLRMEGDGQVRHWRVMVVR